MSRRSTPFRRTPDGIEFRFPPALTEMLGDVPRLLASVSEDEPAAGRLRVPVYLDDPEANREWWDFMESELESSRAADRSAFAELLAHEDRPVVASTAEAQAFLRVLVEARLVLGARVGIETEADYQRLEPAAAWAMDALGWVEEMLIEALSG